LFSILSPLLPSGNVPGKIHGRDGNNRDVFLHRGVLKPRGVKIEKRDLSGKPVYVSGAMVDLENFFKITI
jgi:hypothetical protein